MLPFFDTCSDDRETAEWSTLVSVELEDLLGKVASTRTSPRQRCEALAKVEELFVKAIKGEKEFVRAWWNVLKLPATCVPLYLIAHIQRLYLELDHFGTCASPSRRGYGSSMEDLVNEIQFCFSILEGLSLNSDDARYLCSRDNVTELLLDIICAPAWYDIESQRDQVVLCQAPQHALDLLTCCIVSTPGSSTRLEAGRGDEAIRILLQKLKKKKEKIIESPAYQATIEKCEDFLLVLDFELDREEQLAKAELGPRRELHEPFDHVEKVRGRRSDTFDRLRRSMTASRDETPMSDDSFKTAESIPKHRDPKARSKMEASSSESSVKGRGSPMKGMAARHNEEVRKDSLSNDNTLHPTNLKREVRSDREDIHWARERDARKADRRRPTKSENLQTLIKDRRHLGLSGDSAKDQVVVADQKPRVSSRRGSPERGREQEHGRERSPAPVILNGNVKEALNCFSRGRRPLIDMQSSGKYSDKEALNSSPLKQIMGPSPAVKRAHARSLSPIKREQSLAIASTHRSLSPTNKNRDRETRRLFTNKKNKA